MRPPRLSARARANRANARKSTGPRTVQGKARVACNALLHGFASRVPFVFDADAVSALAAQIAAGDPLACAAAEAHLALHAIRRVRRELQERLTAQLRREVGPRPPYVAPVVVVGSVERAVLEAARSRLPQELTALRRLICLDRYERQALAARRRAFPALAQRSQSEASNAPH